MTNINAETTLKRQYKRQNDFNRDNYDRIGLVFPKGYKEKIKNAACGKSVNAYIMELIDNDIKNRSEKEEKLPWEDLENL